MLQECLFNIHNFVLRLRFLQVSIYWKPRWLQRKPFLWVSCLQWTHSMTCKELHYVCAEWGLRLCKKAEPLFSVLPDKIEGPCNTVNEVNARKKWPEKMFDSGEQFFKSPCIALCLPLLDGALLFKENVVVKLRLLVHLTLCAFLLSMCSNW